MHHKFCMIDFQKVILGSYNWTNNANYNKEDIAVIESRDKSEDFAKQFMQLKNEAKIYMKTV